MLGHTKVAFRLSDVTRCCSAAVTSVAWSKDGRMLLSGSLDKAVSLWDLEDNKQVLTNVLALLSCSTLCVAHHSIATIRQLHRLHHQQTPKFG